MTQSEAILNHLRKEGSITPIDALRKFGCFRLGARILDLRKRGFDIETTMVLNKHKNHFASYSLKRG